MELCGGGGIGGAAAIQQLFTRVLLLADDDDDIDVSPIHEEKRPFLTLPLTQRNGRRREHPPLQKCVEVVWPLKCH